MVNQFFSLGLPLLSCAPFPLAPVLGTGKHHQPDDARGRVPGMGCHRTEPGRHMNE